MSVLLPVLHCELQWLWSRQFGPGLRHRFHHLDKQKRKDVPADVPCFRTCGQLHLCALLVWVIGLREESGMWHCPPPKTELLGIEPKSLFGHQPMQLLLTKVQHRNDA